VKLSGKEKKSSKKEEEINSFNLVFAMAASLRGS